MLFRLTRSTSPSTSTASVVSSHQVYIAEYYRKCCFEDYVAEWYLKECCGRSCVLPEGVESRVFSTLNTATKNNLVVLALFHDVFYFPDFAQHDWKAEALVWGPLIPLMWDVRAPVDEDGDALDGDGASRVVDGGDGQADGGDSRVVDCRDGRVVDGDRPPASINEASLNNGGASNPMDRDENREFGVAQRILQLIFAEPCQAKTLRAESGPASGEDVPKAFSEMALSQLLGGDLISEHVTIGVTNPE